MFLQARGRTDAGPSRPAAGPEAASVTRGEGVVSLLPHAQRHPPLPLANATHVCAAAVTCIYWLVTGDVFVGCDMGQ